MVAIAIVSVFFLAGCADDISSNNSGGTGDGGNNNGGGGDGNSGSSSSATSSTKFDAPTGLIVIADNANSVTISWVSVSGATSYKIYRSSSEFGDYSTVGTATGSLNTSYTQTHNSYSSLEYNQVNPNTIYYYRVTALNSSKESDKSFAVSVTTPPSTPSNLKINVDSTASITISWGTVSGAVVYSVYRSSSETGDYSKIGTASTGSYTDKNELSDNIRYYYKVSAENSGGAESSLSSIISATTAPNIPTEVTAVADSERSVTISWSSVSGATSYKIYRSSGESGDYSAVGTATGSLNTSYTQTHNSYSSLEYNQVNSNTIYYYRVTALNGSGESTKSFAVSVTTPASN